MKIVVAQSPETSFPIEEGSSLIGRWDPETGSFPEVDLENHDRENKVSRKHAILERQGDVVTLEDLGSLNGTFTVQGERLEPGQRRMLKAGDEFFVGNVLLKLED